MLAESASSQGIGKRLKLLRQSKKLSQKSVALKAGMKATMLCRIERGEKDPKFSTVERILDAMDADLSDLENSELYNTKAASP